ncbi:MAG: cobalt ECF transporter T component CbiQ [Microcoleaceae cyanobacterium]
MHHQIDSLAYTNRLRNLPPTHKLLFAITLFILSWVAPAIIQLLIALWVAVWIICYAGIPAQIYLKLQTIVFSFWFMSVPALVLNIAKLSHIESIQTDIYWGITIGNIFLYISNQGIEQVSIILCRSMALTACVYFILLTIPFVEIIRILQNLGCPNLITELLTLMYRFIFLLTETASELLIAQQTRVGYSNFKIGIRSAAIIISQLLRRTLENYRQIALGLTSRGFMGEFRVLSVRHYQSSIRYGTEAIGGCLLLLIMIGWHYVAKT